MGSPSPLVEICCIASVEEAHVAQAAGAAALGLASAMPSGPGVITDARIAEIAAAMRGTSARTFLLTTGTDAAGIAAQHRAASTRTLQLVDHVAHEALRRLRVLCPGVELVQGTHVTSEAAVDEALAVAPLVDPDRRAAQRLGPVHGRTQRRTARCRQAHRLRAGPAHRRLSRGYDALPRRLGRITSAHHLGPP